MQAPAIEIVESSATAMKESSYSTNPSFNIIDPFGGGRENTIDMTDVPSTRAGENSILAGRSNSITASGGSRLRHGSMLHLDSRRKPIDPSLDSTRVSTMVGSLEWEARSDGRIQCATATAAPSRFR